MPDHAALLTLNEPAIARLRALPSEERRRRPMIVVPGFVPLGATTPVPLHAVAERRLIEAMKARNELDALGFLVTGGAVHPAGTPYVEAEEMRRYLVGHGVAPEDVLVEPYARHSTTNLRNAGRWLRALGVGHAVVVTDPGQGFYFGFPSLSTFHLRCRRTLGYEVGALTRVGGLRRIRFDPAPEVDRPGDDPEDP